MSDKPFLSIVTRHLLTSTRAGMMTANRMSVARQTCHDYEQITIIDREGQGRRWAAQQLYEDRDLVRGEYVLVLDDDDELDMIDFVAELRKIAHEHKPDVIICKCDHRHGVGILPDTRTWGMRPVIGRIGTPSMIVRADIWKKYCHTYAEPERREGDGLLIQRIWDAGYKFLWWDVVASHRNAIGALEK